jgi:hypothetical protein
VFIVPKTLLCNSSAYFKAALNGPFIEGQTQTIDLDDEDPSIFWTYIAWLYQGQLNSRDIEEDIDEPQDIGLHIAKVIVFADKRDISELQNDAISMLLSYLQKCGLATLEVINCIYNMPRSLEISVLRRLFADDEVWYGHRLEKNIYHWHPEFMAEIVRVYKNFPPLLSRLTSSSGPAVLCACLHKHTVGAPSCPSLVKNIYVPAPPPAQQPPNKKRKIMPSTETVELLDD